MITKDQAKKSLIYWHSETNQQAILILMIL